MPRSTKKLGELHLRLIFGWRGHTQSLAVAKLNDVEVFLLQKSCETGKWNYNWPLSSLMTNAYFNLRDVSTWTSYVRIAPFSRWRSWLGAVTRKETFAPSSLLILLATRQKVSQISSSCTFTLFDPILSVSGTRGIFVFLHKSQIGCTIPSAHQPYSSCYKYSCFEASSPVNLLLKVEFWNRDCYDLLESLE